MKLKDLVRENIWQLKPYSSARHEFTGLAEVYLDANENPYESGYNRYPDPLQKKLKALIADLKGLPAEHIFLGNGSDEAIDILIRIFCRPGLDEVMILPPTYGMYRVSADISDVSVRIQNLTTDFQPPVEEILNASRSETKLLFMCSPNNPTGNLMHKDQVMEILNAFSGIVIIDEAYIDFSSEPSWTGALSQYKNLVVLQTFSKAWGLAGIRLGMAFAHPEIVRLMNAVKPPYNINQLTQEKALDTLQHGTETRDQQVKTLVKERTKLANNLSGHPSVIEVFPSDANFLLVRFHQHEKIFHTLRNRGIVIRDRSNVPHCAQCLRITIGTPEENELLLRALNEMQ